MFEPRSIIPTDFDREEPSILPRLYFALYMNVSSISRPTPEMEVSLHNSLHYVINRVESVLQECINAHRSSSAIMYSTTFFMIMILDRVGVDNLKC